MYFKINNKKISCIIVLFCIAKVYPGISDEDNFIDQIPRIYQRYSEILSEDFKQPCCIFRSKKSNPESEALKEQHRIAYLSEMNKIEETPDELFVPDERYAVLESCSICEREKIVKMLDDLHLILKQVLQLKNVARYGVRDDESNMRCRKEILSEGSSLVFSDGVKAKNPKKLINELLDAILTLKSAEIMDEKYFKKNEEKICDLADLEKGNAEKYFDFCAQFRNVLLKDSICWEPNPLYNRGKLEL